MSNTIEITGTGGIIEGNLGTANVNVNLDGVLSFDNVSANNDRVVIADDDAATTGDFGTGAFSISFWFYHAEGGFSGDTWGGVITKGYTTSAPANTWGIVRRATNTSQIVYQQATDAGGGYSDTLYGPSGVEGHGWKHYVITRSGTDTKMYVDGILFDDNTASETSNLSNSSNLQFGTWNETEDFGPFYLADVKFFTDAITADEVKFLASKIQADPDVGGLDNCVSWWKLNEGTGTNAANSISAGDNGTITGAEWVYDAFSVDVYDNSTTTDGTFTVTQGKVEGKALTSVDLDGSNDYISLGTGLTTFDGATEGTFSAWVKRDGTGSEDSIISHYDSTDSNRQFNFLVNASNQAKLVIQNDKANFNSAHDVAGTTSFASGVWYHMVGTFSTTNGQKIYVNGVLEGTAATTIEDALDTVTTDANIGVLEQGGSLQAHTNGNVKDVRLYTQELSADQVASLYSNTLPITPTNWWKIDDATQTATATIEDYGTGTDVDGTGVSLTWTNGTLDLDGNLTIQTNGTLSAPRGNLEVAGASFTDHGTFTHNNGALVGTGGASTLLLGNSNTKFYDIKSPSTGSGIATFKQYTTKTIEHNISEGSLECQYQLVSDAITLTLGTTSYASQISCSYFDGAVVANQYVYGASELNPAVFVSSIDYLRFTGHTGQGSYMATNAHIKNVDIQKAITTPSDTKTLTLDGDCEFDAVTVSSGDTLDLNGQRAVFGGAFDLTTGALAMNDSMAVFTNTIDFNGRVPTSNTGTTIIHNPPSTSEKLITSLYFGGTFFAQGAESDVNGYAWGGSSGEYPAKVFVGGQLDCQQSVKTTTTMQVATGGELRGNDRTITCEGDFTMSGGLIGKSALNLTGAEEVTGSDNLDEVATTNKFTIEAWFKASTDANYRAIFSRGTSWSTGNLYVYMNSDGYVQASANDLGNTLTSTTAGLADDKWHHVAYTYNTTTISLYIDGKLEATAASTAGINTQTAGFKIGDRDGDNWVGNIGRVSVWKDALSETLIRKMLFMDWTTMAADSDFTDSDAIGWWQFDEGTGTAVEDLSSQSNDGTLNSAAWAGAGTFTHGTSTLDMTDDGTIGIAGGVTQFNNLKVAASGKTTTLAVLGGSSDIRFYGTLTHGGGTASSSGNPAWTMKGTSTVSAGSNWTGWYLCYWESSTAVPTASWKYWLALTDSTLAGDMTCTGYFRPHQSVVTFAGNTLTTNDAIFHSTGGVDMGSGSLIFTQATGLSSTQSDSVFTGGPGATVTGVAAKSTFMSQNNFAIVGKAENLNVTNEELKVTGQVINCTGDIHQYFPTIDHNQQLDADTADDRDVRLGRDLDKNTELINS